MLPNMMRWQQSMVNRDLSPKTIEAYSWWLERFEEWLEGREITVDLIGDYQASLIESHSAESRNMNAKTLKSYFRFLGRDDLRGAVVTARPPQRESDAFEFEEVLERLRAVCPAGSRNIRKRRIRFFGEMLLFTGLRSMELLNLELDDIDWSDICRAPAGALQISWGKATGNVSWCYRSSRRSRLSGIRVWISGFALSWNGGWRKSVPSLIRSVTVCF